MLRWKLKTTVAEFWTVDGDDRHDHLGDAARGTATNPRLARPGRGFLPLEPTWRKLRLAEGVDERLDVLLLHETYCV